MARSLAASVSASDVTLYRSPYIVKAHRVSAGRCEGTVLPTLVRRHFFFAYRIPYRRIFRHNFFDFRSPVDGTKVGYFIRERVRMVISISSRRL